MKSTEAKSPKSKSKTQRSLRRSVKVKYEPLPAASMVKSMTEFFDLNDYCIDEICEWLPLSSLASLGMALVKITKIIDKFIIVHYQTSYSG